MVTLFGDLRYAVRMLMKKPGFSLVAVLTLALGIGANSAIFSVINGVLLKPLRYKEPDKLVAIWETLPLGGFGTISAPNFLEYREQKDIFDSISAFQYKNVNLSSTEQPQRVIAATVSANFFDVVGVNPQNGRGFFSGEDTAGNERVVVLSDKIWKRDFGSNANVVGNNITLNGESYKVVGVMPGAFDYPSQNTEIWVPLVFTQDDLNKRFDNKFQAVARLKEGVSLEQARAQMHTVAKRLEQQYPDGRTGRGIDVSTVQENQTRYIKPSLLILMCAVAFVLLIACANVANLLLANAVTRKKEIAIRSALGAGRFRIIRQFLTESLLLFLLGGIAGLVLAKWMLDGLLYLSTGFLPRISEVQVDLRVVAFALLSSLFTGLVFGLIPAFQTSKSDVQESLKEGGSRSGTTRSAFRNALVVTEIAAALLLLIGSGLLIKSFIRLQQAELGLQTENVLTMKFALPESRYKTDGDTTVFIKTLLERVSTLPDVESAGMIDLLPIRETGSNSDMTIEGNPPFPPGKTPYTEMRVVAGDYFKTLGIRLIAGRTNDSSDSEKTERVVIVNQAFVRALNSGENPVGKYISRDNGHIKIVGVVSDIRESGIAIEPRPTAYFPQSQTGTRGMSLVVRSKTNSSALTASIRREVSAIDSLQPVYNILTMNEVVARNAWSYRTNMLLMSVFGGVAILLAVIGIYGVMSYTVSQRTQEIGIRMALGAERKNIFAIIIRQGMTVTLIGIVLGLAGAFVLTRLMSSLLYGVTTTDAFIFATVPVLLVLTALASCFLPARRATKVSPLVALRYE